MNGERRAARELFVWYRVAGDRAERVRAEVEAMQRALEVQSPGLRARLLIRDDGTGPQTWMETYASHAPDATGIDDAMQARIESAAEPIRRRIEGERHVEIFEVVART